MDTLKVIKNEEYFKAARFVLTQARRQVDIATFKFEFSQRIDARPLNSLIDILYTLANNKVIVRVLLDTTGRRSGLARINRRAAGTLRQRGIDVRTLPDSRCQHAKILLVDGCLGIIGSHNWSWRSMTENFEVSVLVYHAGHLQELQEHFDRLWNLSKEV